VNLEPTADQRALVAALRRASAAAPEAVAWDLFEAAGLTAAAGNDVPAALRWGLLDWCLALEEAGSQALDADLAWAVCAELNAHADRTSQRLDSLVRRCRAGADAYASRPHAPADALSDSELIARAAYAVGVGRSCLRLGQARAADRTVSGRRLIEFQGPAHRLGRAAVLLAEARIGVWRAAAAEDAGTPAGCAAAACAAAVDAALDAAHEMVQLHGAAGTSDRRIVKLYQLAYSLPRVCGSPRLLWGRAGRQWLADAASPAAC